MAADEAGPAEDDGVTVAEVKAGEVNRASLDKREARPGPSWLELKGRLHNLYASPPHEPTDLDHRRRRIRRRRSRTALLEAGREVRILDTSSTARSPREGSRDSRRQADDRRHPRCRGAPAALEGAEAVVHLAAIVGDPACARDPELARGHQRRGDAIARSRTPSAAGVAHLIFASTCSNYGRMADPETPVDEEAPLAPVSLYAEQKVEIEKMLLSTAARIDGADLPALRHGLRRRAAYALRPDRQRVHPRTMGRPRA